MCLHCKRKHKHPQWAWLMSDKRQTPAQLLGEEEGCVTTSTWDFGRQPLWSVQAHNRDRRFRMGPRFKATKHVAPNHQIELIIGPFTHNASKFVAVMRARNRKFRNKVGRAVWLAKVWPLIDPHQGGTQLRVGGSELAGHADMLNQLCAQTTVKQLLVLVGAARAELRV